MSETVIEGGLVGGRQRLAPGDQPIVLRKVKTESLFIAETRDLPRRERDRYSSMLWSLVKLDLPPKVQIVDLVGRKLDAPLGAESEGALLSVVNHYHDQTSHADLNQVLKFFAVYLMQRARREQSFARQQYVLFKAVDLLRMLSQYSTWAAHREAEALVYVIFDALGAQKPDRFRRYRDTELRIYPMLKRVAEAPRDLHVRLELADALVEQTSFFDALIQYDFLRRFYPRFFSGGGLERRQGVIASRAAGVFQNILDHLGKGYADARKLNAFVDRYNRHFGTRKLTLAPVGESGRVDKTAQGLRRAAEQWYRLALGNKAVPGLLQVRNAAAMARNLAAERRSAEALKVMTDAAPFWRGIDMAPDVLRERVEWLGQVVELGARTGRREQTKWAAEQQREYGARLEEQMQRRHSYQKRREEILRESQEEEPEEV